MNRLRPAVIFIMAFLAACAPSAPTESPSSKQPSPPDAGLASFNALDLSPLIQKLSSDEFDGRLPGSQGEELTVNELVGQFTRLGLKPGNPDGTYIQKVPLVGITPDKTMTLTFTGPGKNLALDYGDQFVAWTKRVVEESSITGSEVVFVGYGAVAPEFDWDDFKGMDVKDKTLIILINDPPVPDPSDPSKLDQTVFGGKAMTYYGRWTYKFEIAAQRGAKGCFIIHETEPAAYPWSVVQGSWTGEQFDLVTPDKNMSRCAVEGWISYDSAKKLFQMAGQDLEALKKSAISRDFTPKAFNLNASATVSNALRTVDSRNVIAELEGSDPTVKDEYVVYMGHWDHLGKDRTLKGDQIYNGAVDNATGLAGLVGLAEAFTKLEVPPRRSLLFLAVTAEEQGLLGSRYYGENPLHPLAKTLAAINIDAMNVLGETKDVTIVGMGNSTLDELVEAGAEEQGRIVVPDPEPQKGFFYRSDHFNFAKQGVPALYLDPGVDFVGRPEGWGIEMREKFTDENYHKPSDEFDPNWDLRGMVQDLRLLFLVGNQVANGDTYPEWKPGTEFEAKREQMLK